jgi:hypothetical protein
MSLGGVALVWIGDGLGSFDAEAQAVKRRMAAQIDKKIFVCMIIVSLRITH